MAKTSGVKEAGMGWPPRRKQGDNERKEAARRRKTRVTEAAGRKNKERMKGTEATRRRTKRVSRKE